MILCDGFLGALSGSSPTLSSGHLFVLNTGLAHCILSLKIVPASKALPLSFCDFSLFCFWTFPNDWIWRFAWLPPPGASRHMCVHTHTHTYARISDSVWLVPRWEWYKEGWQNDRCVCMGGCGLMSASLHPSNRRGLICFISCSITSP